MPQRKRNTRRKATSNAQANSLVKAVKQLTVSKKPKGKPFRDTGGIVGNRIGGMFGNASIGRGIGRWLGTGIGSIFGSGDYTLAGSQPAYNVMANGAQIPKFDSTRQTNVVCHREYLGDILGTAGFTNRQYPLNPGMSTTFPWLSTVAANYQEYKFHGIVFEFRSLLTDFVTGGAPGVIVMSTNYNADAPVYTTKQQMENAEFAVSTKPTINLMHGVECADVQTILPQRYVRSAAPSAGQDLRLYDLGNFQFATASNPIQDLGELWVSYCVEFFKPIQPTFTSIPSAGEHTIRFGVGSANPLGTNLSVSTGNLDVTIDNSTVNINNAQPGIRYKIDLLWFGTSTGLVAFPGIGVSSVATSFYNGYRNGSTGNTVAPTAPVASSTMNDSMTIFNNSTLSTTIGVTVLPGGVFPGGTATVDIYVVSLDPSMA